MQPVDVVEEPVQPHASASDDKAPAADVLNCLMEKLPEDMIGDQATASARVVNQV